MLISQVLAFVRNSLVKKKKKKKAVNIYFCDTRIHGGYDYVVCKQGLLIMKSERSLVTRIMLYHTIQGKRNDSIIINYNCDYV